MPTVRISTNWQHPAEMEWCGAPPIGDDNHIQRTLKIPEQAYQRIEAAIAQGHLEGSVYLPDGSRFQWFLDR
jgi:hypothetical protein